MKARSRYFAVAILLLALPRSRHRAIASPSSPITTVIGGWIEKSRSSSKRHLRAIKAWERPVDPDPVPTIEELEATVTDEDIDDVLDRMIVEGPSSSAKKGGIIIRRYRPERSWLWSRWSGTILYHSLGSALINMSVTLAFCLFVRRITHGNWKLGVAPDPDHPIIARLVELEKVWKGTSALTTFLLTFFVGQAYNFWRTFYDIGRKIQGRLNDIGLLLATHAARDERDGRYTSEAASFLEDVAYYLRNFHVFVWACHARRFRVLLTDRGLNRMVERGVLRRSDLEALEKLSIPPTQKHIVFLEWTVVRIREAMRRNRGRRPILEGGPGLEQVLLDKVCAVRGTYGSIGDNLDGRMPLAYAHFVQILVDSFLWFAPLAQYADLEVFSILSVGILTLFYSGLLDLAKVFLDPLDNEDYCEGIVHMDLAVLIRETYSASTRWMCAGGVKVTSDGRSLK